MGATGSTLSTFTDNPKTQRKHVRQGQLGLLKGGKAGYDKRIIPYPDIGTIKEKNEKFLDSFTLEKSVKVRKNAQESLYMRTWPLAYPNNDDNSNSYSQVYPFGLGDCRSQINGTSDLVLANSQGVFKDDDQLFRTSSLDYTMMSDLLSPDGNSHGKKTIAPVSLIDGLGKSFEVQVQKYDTAQAELPTKSMEISNNNTKPINEGSQSLNIQAKFRNSLQNMSVKTLKLNQDVISPNQSWVVSRKASTHSNSQMNHGNVNDIDAMANYHVIEDIDSEDNSPTVCHNALRDSKLSSIYSHEVNSYPKLFEGYNMSGDISGLSAIVKQYVADTCIVRLKTPSEYIELIGSENIINILKAAIGSFTNRVTYLQDMSWKISETGEVYLNFKTITSVTTKFDNPVLRNILSTTFLDWMKNNDFCDSTVSPREKEDIKRSLAKAEGFRNIVMKHNFNLYLDKISGKIGIYEVTTKILKILRT